MAAQPNPPSLCEYLMTFNSTADKPNAFTKATQSPFLRKAGSGTLPKSTLSQWLAQDRLYAQAYIRFASLLLANVPLCLPVKPDPEDVYEKLTDLLIASIANVRRELKFFEDVASRYALDLSATEASEGVARYRELFFGVAEGVEASKRKILDGLVVLWGTEKCYLEAWRYAKGFCGKGEDEDGGALRREFIPNWTSVEFGKFVGELEWFVDELWKVDPCREEDGERERLRGVWMELLDVERVFWPVVQE